MPDSDLLPSLLYKLHENQLALEAAILELSNWVEQRGSVDIADNARSAPPPFGVPSKLTAIQICTPFVTDLYRVGYARIRTGLILQVEHNQQ
ncbi:hypothetical protein [Pseudomonas sp. GM55]|uniref:hypothetical protein n=1 Tax=Pseudomonas sp. GM55 TaxID=1144333 RepID=UPI00027087DC|nr:hypothetical protein [Pseudomonas sp. GM55]EJM69388.1 hypothetical protein PMI31_04731 [Pseudomonas sp. GM55]